MTFFARTKDFVFLIFLGLVSMAALPSSLGRITWIYLNGKKPDKHFSSERI
jgi:hypothetical protein